ncbi:hypothetical protein [Arthrobacter sp. Y81]|uniref:hypothetical protein n=1 Tax=Arthrobacter sp. Y81 TaxID=2058897 RepID=UPI000CE479F0|nr:hypothetical protein [Arthrobacter sp. Y81]
MKRRASNDLKRAYAVWTIAGTSLIVAAVAGFPIFAVLTGTADAGTLAWGIVGIASRWRRWCSLAMDSGFGTGT